MMQITLGQAYSFHQLGQRKNQEDARFPDMDKPRLGQPFYLVCDGVGGSEQGEMASATVCKAFAKALSRTDFSEDFSTDEFSKALDAAYNALDKESKNHGGTQFATTMTFAAFHGGGCTLAHIGDSRIYQVRPGIGIVYRSDDHSLVNQMVRSGMITPDEAETHPQGNVITRYMGPVDEDEARSRATVMRIDDVKAGDFFLMCTDGVLHCVDDDKLSKIIGKSQNAAKAIAEIAGLCKNSTDNNTAFLIPVVEVIDGVANSVASMDVEGGDTMRTVNGGPTVAEVESVQHQEEPAHGLKRLWNSLRGKKQ